MDFRLTKDEIDKWLAEECHIFAGCCSSIEELKYEVAREVAEKLWNKPNKPNNTIMTKLEFVKQMKELREKEDSLKKEYLHSNIIIPSNNIVNITYKNTVKKLYLFDYRIENNDIFVICYPIVHNDITDNDMVYLINYDSFNRYEKLDYKNRFKLNEIEMKLIEAKIDNDIIFYL